MSFISAAMTKLELLYLPGGVLCTTEPPYPPPLPFRAAVGSDPALLPETRFLHKEAIHVAWLFHADGWRPPRSSPPTHHFLQPYRLGPRLPDGLSQQFRIPVSEVLLLLDVLPAFVFHTCANRRDVRWQ